MPRIDVILRRLGITKQHVIDYCKEKYPHILSTVTYFPLNGSKPVEVENWSVGFRDMVFIYLHGHNIRVAPMKELESFKIE